MFYLTILPTLFAMEDAFGRLRYAAQRVATVHDRAVTSGIDGIGGPRRPGHAFADSASLHLGSTSVSSFLRQLTDESVTQLLWQLGELRRSTETLTAVVAGEVAGRSRRSDSSAGLAQRNGFRAPTAMVRAITGLSRDDAVRLVQVGELIVDAEQSIDARSSVDELGLDIDVDDTWTVPIGIAVVSGGLSIAAAHAIMRGLGEAADSVAAAALEDAAVRLVADTRDVLPDELYRRARRMRTELEAASGTARAEHGSRPRVAVSPG